MGLDPAADEHLMGIDLAADEHLMGIDPAADAFMDLTSNSI